MLAEKISILQLGQFNLETYFEFCLDRGNLDFLTFNSLLDHYIYVGRWCASDVSAYLFSKANSRPEAHVEEPPEPQPQPPAAAQPDDAVAPPTPPASPVDAVDHGDFRSSFKIRGAVDHITTVSASGWVWAPEHPDAALLVEVLRDDHVVGRGVASSFRQDLYKHGMGTGRYGFVVRFQETLPPGSRPTFRVLMVAEQDIDYQVEVMDGGGAVNAEFSTAANLVADHQRFTSRGPAYEDRDPTIVAAVRDGAPTPAPLLLAFYLPQFHAVAENDEFWGAGFTEWRQLPRALSRFPGHYQPRIPRDLGFYNLTSEETIRRQVDMALRLRASAHSASTITGSTAAACWRDRSISSARQ